MPKCIVIADDLTGANATGVLLKKMNYSAYTVLNAERLELSMLEQCDCVLYPTDSRGIDQDLAYRRVSNVCNLLKNEDTKVYGKRIDSTLRGNLGAEVDAMLESLGEDYVAIVVACFPTSSRIVLGGYMLVEGLPLHKTDIAIDPKTPVNNPEVAELFRKQSKYPIASILMKDLLHGKHYLADCMKKLVEEGNRIIVVDCVSQEDIDLIADAVETSKLKVLAVDPGVFTASLVRKRIPPTEKKEKNKVLAVVGSVNPHTRLQLEELWLSQRCKNVFVETKALLEGEEQWEQEVQRVVDAILKDVDKDRVFTVTGDGIYPENRVDLGKLAESRACQIEEISNKMNLAFAEIAHRICEREKSFKGIYSSGGDVTVSICKRFQTAGLSLEEEVLPLAAHGEMLLGDFPGMHMVTKGGSQGGRDAIIRCISFLKEKLFV